MSDGRPKRPAPSAPRAPGTSPLWYLSAAGAVLLAFLVGLWFDRQASDAGQASGGMPPGHPPLAEGAPPAPSPVATYDPGDPAEVWTVSCAKCHGADGEPTAAAANLDTPDLRDGARLADLSDEDIAGVIREGGQGMPAYADKLPDETIDALIQKVRALAAP